MQKESWLFAFWKRISPGSEPQVLPAYVRVMRQMNEIISQHKYERLSTAFFQPLQNGMDQTTSNQLLEKLEFKMINYAVQLSMDSSSRKHKQFFDNVMKSQILDRFSKQTQETIKTLYKNAEALSSLFAFIRQLTKQCIDEKNEEMQIATEPFNSFDMLKFTKDQQLDLTNLLVKIKEIEKGRIGSKTEIKNCLGKLIKKYDLSSSNDIVDRKSIDISLLCGELERVFSQYTQAVIKRKNDQLESLTQIIQTQMKKRNSNLPNKKDRKKNDPHKRLSKAIDSIFAALDEQNKLFKEEVEEKRKKEGLNQAFLKEKDLLVVSLKEEAQSFKTLQTSLRQEIRASKDSANQWKSKYENLKPEHDKMVAEFTQSKKKVEDFQEKVRILEQQNQEYKNKLIDDLRQIGQLSEQKNFLKEQVFLMSENVQTLAKLNRSNQKTLLTQSETIKKQKDCITELEEEREKLDHNLSTKNQQVSALGQEIHSLQAKNSELEERLSDLDPYDKLFSHQILDGRSQDKQFLAETLEKKYNSPVQNTKLICKLDPLNKINFHRYLDGVSCLLIIAHLENQKMVAAFTLSPFLQGKKGEDALLFSINNQKVYELKQGARAITYDDYFLIFGNSELRFKTCQSLVFSNFAVNNGYFNSRGDTVDVLFGQGPKKREMPIIGYQVYQVRFKSGLHLKYQQ